MEPEQATATEAPEAPEPATEAPPSGAIGPRGEPCNNAVQQRHAPTPVRIDRSVLLSVLLALAAAFVLAAVYFLFTDAPGTFQSGKRLTDVVLCLIGLAVSLSGAGVIGA